MVRASALPRPFRVTTLPSGMRVVLAPDDRSPVVAFQAWVGVGSADERSHERGLAHVLEHMLFKGTGRRGVGEIAQEIEGCGGDINAYTSFDTTVYHLVLASRFFDRGLDVLSDAVTRSAIDARELALEKEVILEEIRRDEDQPSSRASHALFRQAYRVHPYGRPVIGTRESVSGFGRDEVVAFYRRWYVPRNVLLVVAGDFDPAEAGRAIAASFRGFDGGTVPARRRAREPRPAAPAGVTLTDDVSEIKVEAAYHIPGLASPAIPALDALALALGQGDRSRLAWRVRRGKRLVSAISSYAYSPADTGLFFVSATVPVDRGLEGGTEALRETFRVLREPISEEELERAKVSIEGDAVYERETVQGMAKKLGFYETVGGGLAEEARYFAAVRALTPADLARVARTYLHPDGLTLVALGPEGKTPALGALRAAAYGAWREATRPSRSGATRARGVGLAGGRGAAQRRPRGAAARRGRREAERERRVTLPDGSTLLLRRDPSIPILALRAVFLGGLRFEEESTAGNTHLVARTICKGTADRSYAEIARAIDRYAGGLSGFSGFNSFGIRLDALSKHVADATDLFCEILQGPTFEQREVDQERRLVLESIKTQEDSPASVALRALTRTMYRRHPYRLSILGEASRIETVDSAELTRFYERLAVPENLSIAAVGDFDPDALADRFAAGLAGFGGGRPFARPAVEPEPPILEPRETVFRKEKEQAHIAIGFPGASFHDADRHALELIATALAGQGGRLFLELRDKQGLAYSVTAFSQEALDPGYFCVYMATEPAKLDRAVAGIHAELERLRTEGIPADELARNQRQLVGSFEIDLQRAASRAANFAFNDRYGLGYRDYRAYPGRVLAVTPGDAVAAARKYLDPRRAVTSVVRP